MSLHDVAQHLKSEGRGTDDQLIHMSSKEVAGLQALAQAHGGSLTINPKTGLPEAGFLDSILPTVAGIGITAMSGGAIDPMTAAAIMGGGTALHTGSLSKGLMAGLGAYGGANIGGGLLGMGEMALGDAAAAGAANAGQDELMQAASRNAAIQEASPFSKLGAGIGQIGTPGTLTNLGGYGALGMAAAPSVLAALSPEQKAAGQTAPGTEQMIRPYTYAANPQKLASAGEAPAPGQQQMLGTQYAPGQDTSERTWFKPQYTALTPYKAAGGGLMSLPNGGNVMSVGGVSQADATGPVVRMAQGGISSLGSYSDGGRMLKGPGNGTSDSIPATIGDKQPARLADGEFVIPARIVSELGNGSTDAGARQLYAMMDRVQNARRKTVGKNKVAFDAKARNQLPA